MPKTLTGTLTGVAFFLFPFLPSLPVLSQSTNTHFFFLVLVVDVLLVCLGIKLLTGSHVLSFEKRPFMWALLGAMGASFVSTVGGVDLWQSLLGDTAYATGFITLAHVGLLGLLLAELTKTNDWVFIRRAVLSGAASLSAISLAGEVLGSTSTSLTLGNETYVGLYLVLALALGLVEFLRSTTVRDRSVIAVLTAIIILSPPLLNVAALLSKQILSDEVLGYARASGVATLVLVASCTVALVLNVVRVPVSPLWSRVTLAALVGILCLTGSFLLLTPQSIVRQYLPDAGLEARFLVWESAKDAFVERPLIGWGPENFDRAYERHFPAGLYSDKNTETWFDNAHNIYLDTLVKFGALGALALLALLLAFLVTIIQIARSGSISPAEMFVLLMVPIVHAVQLQTSFDTVVSYALLGLIAGYVLHYERQAQTQKKGKHKYQSYFAAGLISIAVLTASYICVYELPRQMSLASSLSERSPEKRLELAEFGLSRASDFNSLRVGSNLLVSSVYAAGNRSSDPAKIYAQALPPLDLYIQGYKRYLTRAPDHCYARTHYAYLLLIRAEWGGESAVEEALTSGGVCNDISPNNPIPVAVLVIANERALHMVEAQQQVLRIGELAPDTRLERQVASWLERSQRSTEKIELLNLGSM